jgi:hypothetical protein
MNILSEKSKANRDLFMGEKRQERIHKANVAVYHSSRIFRVASSRSVWQAKTEEHKLYIKWWIAHSG